MRLRIIGLLLLAALAAQGQVIVGNYPIQYVSTAPSGTCSGNAPIQMVVGPGTLYSCQSGSWAQTGGGGGGGTPAGLTGQVQYNNAGAFAGAAGLITDGTNVGVGGLTSVPTTLFAAGSGANIYLQLNPPTGTFIASGGIQMYPAGASANARIYTSGSALQLSGVNGSSVVLGYPSSGNGFLFQVNGSWVNFFTASGTATGGTPAITASGTDTNISLNILGKGTGSIGFPGSVAIFSNGNMSMNAHAISSVSSVTGSVGAGATLMLGSANATGQLIFQSGNGVEAGRFDANQNLGIGTTTPQAKLDVNDTIRAATYTVATLPACSGTNQGAWANVSDATSPTYLGTLTGGGTTYTPVVCNGTAWVAH